MLNIHSLVSLSCMLNRQQYCSKWILSILNHFQKPKFNLTKHITDMKMYITETECIYIPLEKKAMI